MSWGVDPSYRTPGGTSEPEAGRSARQVILLQRSKGKPGDKLGKTTGSIHRAALKARGVAAAGGAVYRRIDDEGLHVTIGGEDKVIPADNVVICAGQEPLRDLYDALKGRGCAVHLIGGADVAAELDAKRAIDQGTRLAAADLAPAGAKGETYPGAHYPSPHPSPTVRGDAFAADGQASLSRLHPLADADTASSKLALASLMGEGLGER